MNEEKSLRHLIREIIESELEEFSSGGIVGGNAPIGDTMHHISFPDDEVNPKRKKRKTRKVQEAASRIVFDSIPQGILGQQIEHFADSIDSLCLAFGGADNPFGKDHGERNRNARKFLLGRP